MVVVRDSSPNGLVRRDWLAVGLPERLGPWIVRAILTLVKMLTTAGFYEDTTKQLVNEAK